MKTFGVREAKAHLSELIDGARRGEEIVITERGTPVARLSAFGSLGTPRPLEDTLRELADEGFLVRARPGKRKLPRPILLESTVNLGALVRDMRR